MLGTAGGAVGEAGVRVEDAMSSCVAVGVKGAEGDGRLVFVGVYVSVEESPDASCAMMAGALPGKALISEGLNRKSSVAEAQRTRSSKMRARNNRLRFLDGAGRVGGEEAGSGWDIGCCFR